MARRTRTYEDYQRIGAKLYAAREELASAYLDTARTFGKTRPEAKAVGTALKLLDDARLELDDTYCAEIPENAVPTGRRHFPIYPGHIPV
jgi:hypothetical protein